MSGRQQSNQGRKEGPQRKSHETRAPEGQTDRPSGLGCGTEAELLSGMAEVLVSIPGTQSCKTQGSKSVSLNGQSEGTWWSCLCPSTHKRQQGGEFHRKRGQQLRAAWLTQAFLSQPKATRGGEGLFPLSAQSPSPREVRAGHGGRN